MMATSIGHEMKSRIDDFIEKETDPNIIFYITKEIEKKELKLLDFISTLGPALTNSDVAVRRKGCDLLSGVISQLNMSVLDQNEVTVLTEFLTARLSDHHSLTATILKGLAPLFTSSLLPGPCIEQMLRVLFKEVTVQTLPQADRLVVYQILEHLINNRLTDIKTLDSDFVLGVIQAVDGEKDPRNLLSVFRIVRSVASTFNMSILSEELFEVVACYFPVDFTPIASQYRSQPFSGGLLNKAIKLRKPPDYGFTITRDQLADSLKECFVASPSFAEFCLPLLLEKLQSSVVSAKLDSLDVLKQACLVYEAKDLDDYSGGLWSSIRNEVFSANNQTEEQALNALTALVKALTENKDPPTKDTETTGNIVDIVFQDCRRYLEESGQGIFLQAGKLLAATAVASRFSSVRVIQLTVPLFVSEFNLNSQASRRQNLLDFFLILLKSTQKFSTLFTNSPLILYKSDLCGLFVSLLSNVNALLRCKAVLGLVGLMASHPTLLTNQERLQISQHLLGLILEDDDANVRDECVTGVSYMSSKYPDIISTTVQPQLVSLLQRDSERSKSHITDVYLLTCLSRTSSSLDMIKLNLPVILKYLSNGLNAGTSPSVEEAIHCCQCLDKIVSTQLSAANDSQAVHSVLQYFITELLARCQELLLSACAPSRAGSVLRQAAVVGGVNTAVRRVVQAVTAADDLQLMIQTYLSSVIDLFLDGDLRNVAGDLSSLVSFQPLQFDSPSEQSNLIGYLTANVCAVSSQDVIPRYEELINRLFNFCKSSCNVSAVVSAAKCLAGLLNKDQNESRLNECLIIYQGELLKSLSDSIATKTSVECLTHVWVWLTKAVVLRGHPTQEIFTNQLVEMLGRADTALIAAEGFSVIMVEQEDVMNRDCHAMVTLFYKQRFFTLTIGPLLQAYTSDAINQNMKSYYMKAVSNLIQHIPQQVMLTELPKLMPVLLQSLSSEDSSLWISTLDTVSDLLIENSQALNNHIDDLIPRLLTLSAYKPDMKVRIAAIRCIDGVTSLVEHKLLPHRLGVVRALGVLLDDHKRLVRQTAARAREHWFLLGDVSS